MPSQYVGCTIEPKAMPFWTLDAVKTMMEREMERRAWAYLEAIGHKMWRKGTMHVELIERNEMQLVKIECDFEQDHREHAVKLDVPVKHFEQLVPHAPESVP